MLNELIKRIKYWEERLIYSNDDQYLEKDQVLHELDHLMHIIEQVIEELKL